MQAFTKSLLIPNLSSCLLSHCKNFATGRCANQELARAAVILEYLFGLMSTKGREVSLINVGVGVGKSKGSSNSGVLLRYGATCFKRVLRAVLGATGGT